MSNPNQNLTTVHQKSNPNNDEDTIDLKELFTTVYQGKWLIFGCLALFASGAAIYAYSSNNIYQADALLEITDTKNQILGELNDLLGSGKAEPTDTEMELLKSRKILGKTIQDLRLHIEQKPHDSLLDSFTSKLNGGLNTLIQKENITPNVEIGDWKISETAKNKTFQLTNQNSKIYTLTTPDQQRYTGQVGVPLKIDNENIITIKNIHGNSGQVFQLTQYSELRSIERLRAAFAVAPKGKNVPVLNLTLTGEDPVLISQILNQIITNYKTENRTKNITTADNGLKFIKNKLEELKPELEKAENNLNQYRAKNTSLDVPSEAKGILESLNKIEMQLVDLHTEESVLAEVYTTEHPAYKAVGDKIKVLQQAKDRLNRQIARMPDTQQAIVRLTRDVETNQAIYVQLLNKQQELEILKASTEGNVNIIDTAMTAENPIKPKRFIIIALGAFVGLFIGVLSVLLKGLLKEQGITSADEIHDMGLSVLSSIPKLASPSFTKKLKDLGPKEQQNKWKDKVNKLFPQQKHTYYASADPKTYPENDGKLSLIAAVSQTSEAAIEALRGLRTFLNFRHLGKTEAEVIMISGAMPKMGKSFVSVNLATVLAQSGHKVLLIDADMHKGYLHQFFNCPNEYKGLADLLTDEKNPNEKTDGQYIYTSNIPNLSVMLNGKTNHKDTRSKKDSMFSSANLSTALLNHRLSAFLERAKPQYDFIVIDTPPVLPINDAAIIGKLLPDITTFLVAKYNETTQEHLQTCVKRLQNNHIPIEGILFNNIDQTAKEFSYYGTYYGKNQNQ